MANIINPSEDKDTRLKNIFDFIKDRQFYCAVAYAKVCKLREDEYNKVNNTKNDYFNRLYTLLAYAFDDPSQNYDYKEIYDFNFKDKRIDDIKYKDFDKDFLDFIFLSIAIKILYSHEVVGLIDEKSVERIELDSLDDDINEDLKEIIYLFYNFKISEYKSLSCLENDEIKKEIITRKEKNSLEIQEFNLEKEIKRYFSNNNDDESKIRRNIFDVNSDLYNDCKNVIDKKDSSCLLEGTLAEAEIYDDIDDDGNLEINNKMLEKYVEEKAKKVVKSFKKYNEISKNIKELLNSVCSYIKKLNNRKIEKQDSCNKYLEVYNEIYSKLESAIEKVEILLYRNNNELEYIAGLSALLYILSNIKDCISIDNKKENYTYQYGKYFYVPFLLSDYVLLDQDFLPDFPSCYFDKKFLPFPIDSEHSLDSYDTKKQEFLKSILPEYLIMEHANKFKKIDYSFYNLKSKLNSKIDDNYTTKKIINEYLDIKDIISEDDINDAKDDSNYDLKDFEGKLELAESFSQLEDVDELKGDSDKARENAFNLYSNFNENIGENFFYKWLCKDHENFSYFLKIKEKYEKYIDDNSDSLSDYWTNKIKSRYSKENINEFIEFLKKYKNFSAVSEILDNGKEFTKNTDLLKDLSNYIDKHDNYFYLTPNARKLNRIIEDELHIAENWENIFSTLKNSFAIDKKILKDLLYSLGFSVQDIKDGMRIELIDGNGKSQKITNCDVFVSDDSNISSEHQFASFIPYIFKNGFKIIFMDEDLVLDDKLLDLVKFSNKDEISTKHTIVFYNYRFKLNERRKFSEAIKTIRTNNNNLFLLIDRVVIYFLLEKFTDSLKIAEQKSKNEQRTVNVQEVINDLLMSIILPFGFYQPYESATSAEKTGDKADKDRANKEIMFVGRKKELNTIKNDFKGPFMIVYGGRQLGKSLLLKHSAKDINRDKNSIAIYVDLKTEKEYGKILKNISNKLEEKNIVNSKKIGDWDQFQTEIEEFLGNENNKGKKIYLLLDEVDGFITSCKNQVEIDKATGKKRKGTDKPFKVIKSISDDYSGRFNVVLAGLNLYIDFKRGFFTEDNRISGQLQKEDANFIHIKPFDVQEAIELIEEPLHYLGLDFSESLSLIYLILYNTNYYPCLIQMYCKELLENMGENYKLYSNGPIYKIAKKHIQKILIQEKFQENVKNAFELTLKLNSNGGNDDGDFTFQYLANMLALLCHKEGYRAYTLDDFKKMANGSDRDIGEIEKISSLDDKDLLNLLDLLEKLSVFEKVNDSYRFKRFSLYKLIGKTENDIRKNLKSYMKKDSERK